MLFRMLYINWCGILGNQQVTNVNNDKLLSLSFPDFWVLLLFVYNICLLLVNIAYKVSFNVYQHKQFI